MNLKDLVGETTIDNLERITQGLKLLEILEKKIANLPGQIKGAPSQSWINDYTLLLIEFKELIKDSKK